MGKKSSKVLDGSFVDDKGAYFSMVFQIILMIGVPILVIFFTGQTIAYFDLIDLIFESNAIYWSLFICIVLTVLAGATKHQGDITIGLMLVMLAIGFGPVLAKYLQ